MLLVIIILENGIKFETTDGVERYSDTKKRCKRRREVKER